MKTRDAESEFSRSVVIVMVMCGMLIAGLLFVSFLVDYGVRNFAGLDACVFTDDGVIVYPNGLQEDIGKPLLCVHR